MGEEKKKSCREGKGRRAKKKGKEEERKKKPASGRPFHSSSLTPAALGAKILMCFPMGRPRIMSEEGRPKRNL